MSVLLMSELMRCEVFDESGRSLGHVHDVRVEQVAPGGPSSAPRYRVEGLVLGRSGWFARLGLHAGDQPEPLRGSDIVAWSDVVRVDPGRITARSG